MSRSGVEENTLGVAVGREHKRQPRRESFERSKRTVAVARARQSGLSGRHFIKGLSVIAASLVVFQLVRFLTTLSLAVNPVPSIVAWVLLFASVLSVRLFLVRHRMRLSNSLFAAIIFVAALVVVLDLYAVWGHANLTVLPSAAPAIIAMFAPLVAIRETRDVLLGAGSLGVLMIIAIIVQPRDSLLMLGPEFVVIFLGIGPPIMAVGLVRGFRRMVERELDLTLVQSTVSAPLHGAGMLASEELAQLDLDAEQLLLDVADGKIPLPLSKEQAEHAAQLASALRRRLVDRRTETWLHHAVSESEFLAPAVQVDDPEGLSGLLSRSQRDGLLEALWLLVGDTPRAESSAVVTIGPIWHDAPRGARKGIRFPITIVTSGVPRRAVDSGTWEAIRAVGLHTEAQHRSSVQIEIRCVVENPADR